MPAGRSLHVVNGCPKQRCMLTTFLASSSGSIMWLPAGLHSYKTVWRDGRCLCAPISSSVGIGLQQSKHILIRHSNCGPTLKRITVSTFFARFIKFLKKHMTAAQSSRETYGTYANVGLA